MKRSAAVATWLGGALVSGSLLTVGNLTVWAQMGPEPCLRFVLFWPLLTLEALGQSACAYGCSGLALLMADGIDGLLPLPLLDTLTLLILCAVAARAIVRGRRRRIGGD